jgi:hypothetical protein
MKSDKGFIVLSFGVLFSLTVIAYGLATNKAKQEEEAPVLSKCDSLIMVTDSLSKRVIKQNRQLNQYKIGLFYLRDKDKEAYDYAINAGNLKFDDGL